MSQHLSQHLRMSRRLALPACLVLLLISSACGTQQSTPLSTGFSTTGSTTSSVFGSTGSTTSSTTGSTTSTNVINTGQTNSSGGSSLCEASGTTECANPNSITAVGASNLTSMQVALQYMQTTQPDPSMTQAQMNSVFTGGAEFLVQVFANIGTAEKILTQSAINAANACITGLSSFSATPSNWNPMGTQLANCLQNILGGGSGGTNGTVIGSTGSSWEN